jgi:peptide deformylase
MLPIRENGDPVLREHAKPVTAGMFDTPELAKILADMSETLDAQPDGVALAAPQVGISYRIFIVRYDRMTEPGEEPVKKTSPELGVFINPEFVKSSRKRSEMQEGCLSVRNIYGTTFRHEQATMKAQDEHGVWFTRGGGGILAQAYQHETDHLDGILFIDHAEEIHEQRRDEHHAVEPA